MKSSIRDRCSAIRYDDRASQLWMWNQAPYFWRDKVKLNFREAAFADLECARSLRHWDVIAQLVHRIENHRAIAPFIVCSTEHGSLYVHDGNHRFEALRLCFRRKLRSLKVRVAVLDPEPGYAFRYHQFSTYGTYLLQSVHPFEQDLAFKALPGEVSRFPETLRPGFGLTPNKPR